MFPKGKGSRVAKMEQALEQFKPRILDNTDPHPHLLVQKMIKMILPRQSEKKKL